MSVNQYDKILSNDYTNLLAKVNQARSHVGLATKTATEIAVGNDIKSSTATALRTWTVEANARIGNAITISITDADTAVGSQIKAVNYNSLETSATQINNYCVCDCDYCSCDCDYCSCDCDYCSCDCDYCSCDDHVDPCSCDTEDHCFNLCGSQCYCEGYCSVDGTCTGDGLCPDCGNDTCFCVDTGCGSETCGAVNCSGDCFGG